MSKSPFSAVRYDIITIHRFEKKKDGEGINSMLLAVKHGINRRFTLS